MWILLAIICLWCSAFLLLTNFLEIMLYKAHPTRQRDRYGGPVRLSIPLSSKEMPIKWSLCKVFMFWVTRNHDKTWNWHCRVHSIILSICNCRITENLTLFNKQRITCLRIVVRTGSKQMFKNISRPHKGASFSSSVPQKIQWICADCSKWRRAI
jgi:hypothetical protein